MAESTLTTRGLFNGFIRTKITFTSIDDAINKNYKLMVKTSEDFYRAYYKIVPVEREVMERAQKSLGKSSEDLLTMDNICTLVRAYYRNNESVDLDLNEEEMNNHINNLLDREMDVIYPKFSDFGKDNIENNKDYPILKSKILKRKMGLK